MKSLRDFLRWRWAALKNGFQDAAAYRLEFFFEVVGSAFVPAMIQWVLWYAVFHVSGNSSMNGMGYEELVSYTWATVLFTQIRGGNHDFELQEMIRSGGLSNYLLRPVGVVEFIYIRGVAPKVFIAGFCLVLGMVFSRWIGIDPFRMIGAMGLAFLGNIIHYQLGAALSTTAFLWEEAYSILMVKNLLVSLLSGELLPLSLFPQSFQWVWKSFPFYLYVYGPAQYALGKWSHQEFLLQSLLACGWIVLGYILVRITWGVGIRRYSSLGG